MFGERTECDVSAYPPHRKVPAAYCRSEGI